MAYTPEQQQWLDYMKRKRELDKLQHLQQQYPTTPDYSNMSLRDELQTRFDLNELNELQQKYGVQQTSPQPATSFGSSTTSVPNYVSALKVPSVISQSSNTAPTQLSQPYGWSKILQALNPISTANAAEYKSNPQTIDYSKYGADFSKEYIDEMLADKRFQRALQEYAIPNEGGYVNNPNDRGKKTKFGISQETYKNEDIENLTRERANAILYRDYWKWNGINTLPDEIAGVVFDYGINSNPLRAIRHTHQVLGITPGNIIGNETREKIRDADLAKFLVDYQNLARQQRYNIVDNDPSQKDFLKGWLNRINNWHLSPRL